MEHQSKFVEYKSPEYDQAVQLRYRLFYKEHNIPIASVLTPREKIATHFVVSTRAQNKVLAYGQLHRVSDDEHQIFQMVVDPDYQRQGLGNHVLHALIAAANESKGQLLTLSARVTQVGFYNQAGFETVGSVFPSSSTGVPHIKMKRDDREF